MRTSRVLREIREGNLASCIKLNIPHPDVVELAGLGGASAVWLCCEHGPAGWETLAHCVRAAKLHDTDTIVRVSKGSYSEYIKPFEADASGVMIPHVANAQEARQIVEMCRFRPLGKRALDGGNQDGAYCQVPLGDYLGHCNREKYLILQIESPEAVEQIEEIAAVDGYEFLLFGPGDYAHRIDHPGEVNHPDILAARKRVEEAARRFGKRLFGVAAGGSLADQWERGYGITCVGADVIALGNAFHEMVARHRLPAPTSPYQSP